MPRKRKVVVNNTEQESIQDKRNEIMKIMYDVQVNEAVHNKCNRNLQKLYKQMEHDDFTSTFILCIKQLMKGDSNQYNNTGLKFMANFVTSFQAEDMHPLFDSITQWIFQTVSLTASIRFRLCEFVNHMMNSLPTDGDIEEFLCDEIMKYMFDRLKDVSPHVRVQAIKALCRLQIIDDPNDEVTQIFLFHLEYDPSPLVRQAVLSSIARSVQTIPFILERLWDVDIKVRRSVLAHMSNFSLNSYTVEQRLTLLEQGLNDCSETVRNVATKVLLPQWLASCDNDFITFLASLKLDENEAEMVRFRTIARLSLLEMFRSQDPCNLINVLPLIETNNNEDTNYYHCIQMDKLTPELSFFWLTLINFFRSDESKCDFLERILPDLTTYCNYVAAFSRKSKSESNAEILVMLIDMLHEFDLSDESGRQSVQNVIPYLIEQSVGDENQIKSFVKIIEKLISTSCDRLQFYVDIVKNIINPIDVDTSLLAAAASDMDPKLEVQIASLKMKLFELKEAETKCLEISDYEKLTEIREEINLCNEQVTTFITSCLRCDSITSKMKKITTQGILKALKLTFYGVCSKAVSQLIPSMVQLYKDVIRVQVESRNMKVRNWALKCTATFSLLYGQLASDAYRIFCKQLSCHEVKSVWIISIGGMFQLVDRYGFKRFVDDKQIIDRVQADTSLNETSMSLDDFHEIARSDKEFVAGEDIMLLFAQYLDSCHDVDLTCELVDGFCRLIANGRFFDEKIMSNLLIMFYNTNTEPKIIQILSVFFETLIRRRKQKYLQLALFETLTTITSDDDTNALIAIQLPSILKFILHSTLNMKGTDSNAPDHVGDLHNDIAITLLTWMDLHLSDQKSLRLLSKHMLLLKVCEDKEIRLNLINLVDQLLEKPLHKVTDNNLKLFKKMLEVTGTDPLQFSSKQPANGTAEEEINFLNENSEEEFEYGEKDNSEGDKNSTGNEKSQSYENNNEHNVENEKIDEYSQENDNADSEDRCVAEKENADMNKSTTTINTINEKENIECRRPVSVKRKPYCLTPLKDSKKICHVQF